MSSIPSSERKTAVEKQPVRVSHLAAFFIFLLLLFSAGLFLFGVYAANWYSGPVFVASKIIPVRAAQVDDQPVPYSRVARLAQAYEVLGEDTQDPFDRALEVSVNRALIRQVAQDLNTGILQEDFENFPLDEPEFSGYLDELGWSVNTYMDVIVEPLLLAQAVEEAAYRSRELQQEPLRRAERILEQLRLGVAFEGLAEQYSADASAELGGDIGYVKNDGLEPHLENIFEFSAGEISDILEDDRHFVIAKVYDVIGHDDERQVGVQIITIDKDDLAAVLKNVRRESNVKVFVR